MNLSRFLKRRRLIDSPIFGVVVVFLGISLSGRGASGTGDRFTPSGRAEILWDTFGVPHIFARNAEALFYAFGWAQMASHAELVLKLYGEARGRAAEYWGGQERLESDRWIRTMGIPTRARAWYGLQAPEFRQNLDAFVAGMNRYARDHAPQLSASGKLVLPIEAVDVLAHLQRVIHFTFVAGPGQVQAQARGWRPTPASNAWAVAPRRSASGRALLLGNPHLPWSDFFLFYEAHLNAPGVNAYGATLVGQPVPAIAFTDYLGWTHTVNTHDGADLYELSLADGGYRWNDSVRAFETEEQIVKYGQADGTLGEERLVIRRSVHGPVVAEKSGRALALRVVGLADANLGQQYWDMLRARNLAQFETALRRLQMPMFTVMYADRDGHILHWFGGQTPVRPKGSWNWSGLVPGDSSDTLWTTTHRYEDLPRVVDPASGWLQNANDPPWTTTFPPALDPARFPAYLAPRGMSFRAQRSARLLAESDHLTLDQFIANKHSTRMELADRILDDLFQAVDQHGSEASRQAAGVLRQWDRCADASSRGAVLFQAFWNEWKQQRGPQGPFAVRWDEQAPRATPRGLSDGPGAAAALAKAGESVRRQFGALDVAWGDVYRLRRGSLDLPANGGPGELGIFRVIDFDQANDGKFVARGGDSFVMAVEFGRPVRARTLLSYGNSSQAGSRHQSDQLPWLERKELRPVWLSRSEIEKHLESRTTF